MVPIFVMAKNDWEFFKKYEAEALVNFKFEGIKSGDRIRAEMMPSGFVYLVDAEGLVFMTRALENVHFRRVPDVDEPGQKEADEP